MKSEIDQSLFNVVSVVRCGACGIEETMQFSADDRDGLRLRLPFGWRYGALHAEIYQQVCKPVCSGDCQTKVEDG